jgi:hypothetical protein
MTQVITADHAKLGTGLVASDTRLVLAITAAPVATPAAALREWFKKPRRSIDSMLSLRNEE